jgi:cytochrome d ubiquinol oxidase subunit II
MPSLELVIAGVMLVALIVYALFGGADYGGGVWDLFARGPRMRQQRELIAHAIGPVWEANHVWLILIVVLLFSSFPLAFAEISTALNIPLTAMLIGIVLRGSAFTFRSYGGQGDAAQRRWSRVFSISSTITPVVLGVVVGAITTDRVRIEGGGFEARFVRPWLGTFQFSVGLFALALFAFLAAVYLAVEAESEELKEDFRRRGLGAAIAVGVMALTTFLLAGAAAPAVSEALGRSGVALPVHAATGVAAVTAIWALWTRRYQLPRAAAVAQVTLIVVGWGLAQYPNLVQPDLSIHAAAAPQITLKFVAGALAAGAFLLFPSLYYMFRVFKR